MIKLVEVLFRQVTVHRVVVSANVQRGEVGVFILFQIVHRRWEWWSWLKLGKIGRYLLGQLNHVWTLPVRYLISYTPHNHCGMIAVAQDHAINVSLPPLVKEQVIVVRVLTFPPHVERLVDHHHTQHITSFEKCW